MVGSEKQQPTKRKPGNLTGPQAKWFEEKKSQPELPDLQPEKSGRVKITSGIRWNSSRTGFVRGQEYIKTTILRVNGRLEVSSSSLLPFFFCSSQLHHCAHRFPTYLDVSLGVFFHSFLIWEWWSAVFKRRLTRTWIYGTTTNKWTTF